jgi:hypothetical protein
VVRKATQSGAKEMSMITGQYRDTNGTIITVRQVWRLPDEFVAEWVSPTGKRDSEKLSRHEIEGMIRVGLMARIYDPVVTS